MSVKGQEIGRVCPRTADLDVAVVGLLVARAAQAGAVAVLEHPGGAGLDGGGGGGLADGRGGGAEGQGEEADGGGGEDGGELHLDGW